MHPYMYKIKYIHTELEERKTVIIIIGSDEDILVHIVACGVINVV